MHVRCMAFLLLCFVLAPGFLQAQPVTGIWRGKIVRGSGLKQSSAPVEIKLVAQGDSIRGTAYYYGSGKSYIRYSLTGYFDIEDGSVKWQDFHMIDMKPKNAKGARGFSENMKFSADYSCPDGKILRLDGKCKLPHEPEMRVELRKMDGAMFPDEWDEVIEGYYTGMNRAEIVDSVWAMLSVPGKPDKSDTDISRDIAAVTPKKEQTETKSNPPANVVKQQPVATPKPVPIVEKPEPKPDTMVAVQQPKTPEKPVTPAPVKTPPKQSGPPQDITAMVAKSNAQNNKPPASPPRVEKPTPKQEPPPIVVAPPASPAKPTEASVAKIENPQMTEAFKVRKQIIQTEIPIVGDALELRFYDNAEVDGDSISLFLNGVMLFQHVRLDVRPYIFKLPLQDLPPISELAMVAENLGAIPPNTAFMEAFVNGKRFTARLESTEVTTGVIRLVKEE